MSSFGCKKRDQTKNGLLIINPKATPDLCTSGGSLWNPPFRPINITFFHTVLISAAAAWLRTTYYHLNFKWIIFSLRLPMLPSSIGALPSQRASIRSVCLCQICNPNLNRLPALALRPSPTSSQLLFSLFAYPSFQTLHSLPSARDVWWCRPAQDKRVTFRKQQRIPSPHFSICFPLITLDCNCFYFVLWHRRGKTWTAPDARRYVFCLSKRLKPVIVPDRCQLGCCCRRHLMPEGWHPFREWCAHTHICSHSVSVWVTAWVSFLVLLHYDAQSLCLGTVHYREQLNDAACLFVYWPVEMKTRQNIKNVYELLMSVKYLISLSSDSLASLLVLTSSRFIVRAQFLPPFLSSWSRAIM